MVLIEKLPGSKNKLTVGTVWGNSIRVIKSVTTKFSKSNTSDSVIPYQTSLFVRMAFLKEAFSME